MWCGYAVYEKIQNEKYWSKNKRIEETVEYEKNSGPSCAQVTSQLIHGRQFSSFAIQMLLVIALLLEIADALIPHLDLLIETIDGGEKLKKQTFLFY